MTPIMLGSTHALLIDRPTGTLATQLHQGLAAKGCVLVRGFPGGLPAFEALTQQLCTRFHVVATRHANRKLEGDRYTTGVMNKNYTLLAHAEGTYRPHDTSPPDTAFFLCQTAPVLPGGETTILDGAAYYEGLPTALRERMAPGVIYEMVWPAERWQNEFGVADEGALKTLLNSRGDVHYSIEAGELHLRYTVAPFTRCRAGIRVFATGMLAHLPAITHPAYRDRNTFSKPTNKLYYADGSPFDEASIHQLLDVHDRLVYAHRWADDELLLLDNSRFMHGRTLVEGDCPRVIISRFGWRR